MPRMDPVTPDHPTFWKEVAESPGGEAIGTCVQCNTCTSSCPVEVLDPGFNIRRIVARVRLGLREDVLSDDTLWACARCHACVARCPKDVRPGDVIEALRYLALREGRTGAGPRHTRAFVESVRDHGRIHEAGVMIDSVGLAGIASEGLLPLRMAWHGKSPALRPPKLRTIREIQTLLEATGGR